MVLDDFFKYVNRSDKYYDLGTDYLIKTFKLKKDSYEFRICHLKHKMYHKKGLENMLLAQKELQRVTNWMIINHEQLKKIDEIELSK